MARENLELVEVPEDLQGIRYWLQGFRADFDSHNHDGANSRKFQTLSAETISTRAISIRKTSFSASVSGLWAGLVGNTFKMNFGNATNFVKWDGTSITIKGDITGGSLNINDKAVIDSSGNAVFIGMQSLNLKAYTNFEASARFISTVGGSGANSFGNQGVTVAPGTTGTSYARLLWWITNYVYFNNPSFTCSMLALGGFQTGDGRAYVGLGSPTIDGSSLVMTGINCAGFRFQKVSGVTTLMAANNNGDGSNFTETILTTISNNDSVELMLRFSATDIKFYYRKNNGSLTLGATHTTRIPTASETYISFMATNSGTTDNFQLQMQCAAYEH